MSGSINLIPGQHIQLNESQMRNLQLPLFVPEKDGYSTSNLPQYAGSHFTWFTTSDKEWLNEKVGTFKRINFVYHLTMHKKYPLPPLNTPTELCGDELISLYIRPEDGRSPRADLQDYFFETVFLGTTENCDSRYLVTMKKV